MPDSKLTRAEQVRAVAFGLATNTVAGHGQRTFGDIFGRAEEIEHWLYQAREPGLVRASVADVPAAFNGKQHAA
jgi:hypothetical protein